MLGDFYENKLLDSKVYNLLCCSDCFGRSHNCARDVGMRLKAVIAGANLLDLKDEIQQKLSLMVESVEMRDEQ